MIPKVIHYCWFGGKKIPLEFRRYMKSWRKFCPDYEIREWNESNIDVACNSFTKGAYEAKAWGFVPDYLRCKILYEHGGIYLDTDVELLRNLDFLLDNDFYIGVSQIGFVCNGGLGFGAVKGNSVVENMMEKYDNLEFDAAKKQSLASPRFNHAVIAEMGYQHSDEPVKIGGALILPCRFLDPIAPGNSGYLLCADSVSIHHYSATWMPLQTRLRRKLINAVGMERVQTLKRLLKK